MSQFLENLYSMLKYFQSLILLKRHRQADTIRTYKNANQQFKCTKHQNLRGSQQKEP